MPPVSEAQRKWAWANKDKNTQEGKAAAEFAKADPGGKLPAKKKAVDRSAHFKGNPGFPSSPEAGSPPPTTYQKHEEREKEVMGAGYKQHEAAEQASWGSGKAHNFNAPHASNAHAISTGPKAGHLRLSGHSGAHRLGKR